MFCSEVVQYQIIVVSTFKFYFCSTVNDTTLTVYVDQTQRKYLNHFVLNYLIRLNNFFVNYQYK